MTNERGGMSTKARQWRQAAPPPHLWCFRREAQKVQALRHFSLTGPRRVGREQGQPLHPGGAWPSLAGQASEEVSDHRAARLHPICDVGETTVRFSKRRKAARQRDMAPELAGGACLGTERQQP